MKKIYLYGLQRSGTNTLETFININYNIKFDNEKQDRKSAGHKHFRIYNNKNTMPNDYKNDIYINSLEDLDNELGGNMNKYIVIYKDIFSWLLSIEKWAKLCNWEKKNKMDYIEDYINFINKWRSFKNNRILFINYNDYLQFIIKGNKNITKNLEKFLNIEQKKIYKIPNKVDQSTKFTKKKLMYYINKNYIKEYTPDEIELIKSKIS